MDPRLRGPVDPQELQIDPRTGMKVRSMYGTSSKIIPDTRFTQNYIANETGTWDTSSRLVRERIRECISLGRIGRKSGHDAESYESYRLLGSLLHTLEDVSKILWTHDHTFHATTALTNHLEYSSLPTQIGASSVFVA